MLGKTVWAVGDGFMSSTKSGGFVSHEAICVLNVSGRCAHITYEVYFEDKEPMKGFSAVVENERTNHIRLDNAINDKGEKIPLNTPYALLIKSDVPVIVQHSRLDVSQPDYSLMTTIAYN